MAKEIITTSKTVENRSPVFSSRFGWAISLLLLTFIGILGTVYSGDSQQSPSNPILGADVAWMLTASALVLLMTPGLSFFYGGMVNPKNVISTMMQSFVAMGVVSILWVTVGFSLSFGESYAGIVGDPRTFFMFSGVGGGSHPTLSPTIPLSLFAVFQLKFAIITPALITGSFAERVRFSSYILFISLWTLLVYPPLAHMTWHPEGLFRVMGVLDFAGGTVVHMSAGFAALAGALLLGRRQVHIARQTHQPANIPFVILGTGMLWFGWFGFNAGSALAANDTAAAAFVTTNTACAAAMLSWLCLDRIQGRQASAMGACIGAVVGLVAITPAAGFVSVGASIMIGVVASLVSSFAVHLGNKTPLDDTLDVFPCHGVGGMTGMILTAVFAKNVGLIHGETSTLIAHLIAMGAAAAYTFIASLLLYKITDLLIPLRVTLEQEEMGLDISQHGESIVAKGL